MAQTLLAFDTHPADAQLGFELGWDHARHGLLLPPEQWLDGNPLQQGWRAGKACFGARTLGASRRVRLWLALRLHAWQRGRAFELADVTPHYLGQIEVAQCPITRRALVQAEASVDRVCDRAGYAAGNLAMMDRADAIIANITPFRGPHMDPGTAFELGYMVAQGKPVMVYTQAVDSLVDRVSEWSGGLVRDAGVLRDRNGHQVENFGLFENLMIEPAATRDDHQIQTVAVPPAFSRVFVCDQGFLAAAHRLRDILAARPASEVPSWVR